MGTQIATATLGDEKATVSMMFNNVIQVSKENGHYNVNFDIRQMIEEALELIKEAEKAEVK